MQTPNHLLRVTFLALAALPVASGAARAQPLPPTPPQNVVQLSATGTVEVEQDLLTMDLGTTLEGRDPAAVQAQVTAAVQAALAQVKPRAQPGALEVRTGRFGLSPRWKDGRMDGWTGTGSLILEGRDFTQVTQAAARVQTLSVRGVGLGLSRAERERAEHEAQALAVQRFRANADELARSFGFSGYTLREVSVGSGDQGYVPMPMAAAAPVAMRSAGAPVPVESGKMLVRITVSGSVQLR